MLHMRYFTKIIQLSVGFFFFRRLRRRIESYRRRQNDCMPRFDQSFSGLCEQNLHDTLQLKQRFLDAKAKRAPKTNKDKKQQESIQSSVHVVSIFLHIFILPSIRPGILHFATLNQSIFVVSKNWSST